MKVKIYSFMLMILFLMSQKGFAQTSTDFQEIKPLEVGDFLPDILLENLLFNDVATVQTADFKGSYLILDFWATWCAPCIASFPKTAELNKIYEGKLKILPVTYQSKDEVEKLFSRTQKLRDLKIPMVYNDNILRVLFPHQTLPHYVWIGPDGKIIASTYGNDITEEKIEQVINGQATVLGSKRDKIIDVDPYKPLLAGNPNFGNTPIYYQSALTGPIDGFPGKYDLIRDDQKRIKKFLFTNTSIKHLMRIGFSDGKNIFHNKLIEIDVQDPEKVTTKKTGEEYKIWKQQGNSFCFELIVPDIPEEQKWALLKSELIKLFPQYLISVEERNSPTLALKSLGDPSHLKSKGGPSKYAFSGISGELQNTTLEMLVVHLNSMYLQRDHRLILNKTGIDFPVDLSIEANLRSVEDLQKALAAYNLVLEEELNPVSKLVIRDNPKFIKP
ncbi:TlpA family protein disulfide reductase [Mongoliitalea daihaiensis]|uniref:TlpA family protein disulfide reductase n=1 Tax=Mongoliitalea daihaiensis TaxID=2782006 RepID=UPI001F40AA8B|nr:TlpA disulfide reductase family protein [Mongoliitalea daihaiensis]UJP64883.1 TlpA family protein disulfide reductase [Mongoliitalea daihaiensis]